MYINSVTFFVSYLLSLIHAKDVNNYYDRRSKLLEEEFKLYVGGNIQLSHDEIIANRILMQMKEKELQNNGIDFSKHYFKYRNDINKSEVYQIIRKMPKGAALHVHSTFMLSAERLLALTYEDNLYICLGDELKFRFSLLTPIQPCSQNWTLISELRNSTPNLHEFDKELKTHFSLYSEDESDLNYDINFIWNKFEKMGNIIYSIIQYRPVREKLFYQTLKEFYNDNIMYVELRSSLSYLHELNGTVHNITYITHLYHRVAENFKRDHSDFVGVKLIITKWRLTETDKFEEVVDTVRKVKHELPHFFAGFDLVGQEDLGKTLLAFEPALDRVKNEMNFYFHSGETNWFGTSSDENLVDAILLNSKRIGHGYALIKHPSLMAIVSEKEMAIEVNVISNVVLSLLSDVRNHPLAVYLALGMPVVLSSDDPGAWGADPLSHDFYVAFVGVASKRADLRMLKQLVINSLKYSALDESAKLTAMAHLNIKWKEFIRCIILSYR